MSRRNFGVLLAIFLGGLALEIPIKPRADAAEEPQPPQGPRVLKTLSAAESRRVDELKTTIDALWRAGKFEEAIAPAGEVVAILEQALGSADWQEADARGQVETLRTIASLSAEGRLAMARAPALVKEESDHFGRGEFREAERIDRELLALRRRWLGKDHVAVAASHNNLADVLIDLHRLEEAEEHHREALRIKATALGEAHPTTARSHDNLGLTLAALGRLPEAANEFQRALDVYRSLFGERHRDTARVREHMGALSRNRGNHAEAETHYRLALDAAIHLHGEDAEATLASRDGLADTLLLQSKHREAEPLLRRNLSIRLERDGEDPRLVHQARCKLAWSLQEQGRHLEAEEECERALNIAKDLYSEQDEWLIRNRNLLGVILLAVGKPMAAEEQHRRALAASLALHGDLNLMSIRCRQNLGAVLREQGRYAEAVEQQREALAAALRLGDFPRSTLAIIHNNLALALEGLGDYGNARNEFQKSLEINRELYGEKGEETARILANLTAGYREEGRYFEAEKFARQALDARIETLGEEHPDTAWSHNTLGWALEGRGEYVEAERHFRLALATQLAALGERHLATITTRAHLAAALDALNQPDAAIDQWERAATAFEESRWIRNTTGLERALVSSRSPFTDLALALARRGEPRPAWERWEADLARGLLDDFSARRARPLTTEERRQEAEILGELQAIDERISQLVARRDHDRDPDQRRRLDEARRRHNAARGRLIAFERQLDEKHGAFAGAPSSLKEIQAALPTDAALVGWADAGNHHWACVVRHEGEPIWVSIPGSGATGAWTEADLGEPSRLREALATANPTWRDLAARVAGRRVDPLRPHLTEVKHLIVLPSPALSGVPVEALLAASPVAADRQVVVTYAPSGSMFARLVQPRPADPAPPRLLAIGDPAFAPAEAATEPPPPPPDQGVAIVAVEPLGNADLQGVRRGDVLLEYNGRVLAGPDDLKIVPANELAKPATVSAKVWSRGKVRELTLAAGPLGVQLDAGRSAGEALLAQRAAEKVLEPLTRGGAWRRLAGTRREVEAIARLFPTDRVHLLLGERATESAVQALAARGELARFRYLHFATHGQADMIVAMNSALILAPDPERPNPDSAAVASLADADGQITAQQIVSGWDLDADLVVLSACQTALGRDAGGEGHLGFSQALLVKGARGVVLSLWKVDDNATALLMSRFYRNLLGAPANRAATPSKARALDEAKRWLRGLSAAEAAAALAGLGGGPNRADRGEIQIVDQKPETLGARPYAHPAHWAAFILIGDPN